MAERTRTATRFDRGALRERLRLLALGGLVGLVAGMGTFTYIKSQLVPWGVGRGWALALVAAAGAYAYLLADDLAESVALSLVGWAVGFAVHVGAWVAPLWLLSYPRAARGLLLPGMLGEAVAGALLASVLTFYGAYFAVLTVGGYLDP